MAVVHSAMASVKGRDGWWDTSRERRSTAAIKYVLDDGFRLVRMRGRAHPLSRRRTEAEADPTSRGGPNGMLLGVGMCSLACAWLG